MLHQLLCTWKLYAAGRRASSCTSTSPLPLKSIRWMNIDESSPDLSEYLQQVDIHRRGWVEHVGIHWIKLRDGYTVAVLKRAPRRKYKIFASESSPLLLCPVVVMIMVTALLETLTSTGATTTSGTAEADGEHPGGISVMEVRTRTTRARMETKMKTTGGVKAGDEGNGNDPRTNSDSDFFDFRFSIFFDFYLFNFTKKTARRTVS